MKILLTYIGNNDCYLNEGKKGAVISILDSERYDKLYLLYNNESYLKPASDILLYCRDKFPELKIEYVEALTQNPTDYNTVYPTMYKAVKEIVSGNPNADFTISITSGTPTMHSCWIFLNQGGVIKARLIQTSIQNGIVDVDFNLDDFPKINNVSEIKAELTKLSRENKNLKEKLNLEHDEIIGESEAIKRIKKQIKILSQYDLSVFINGESGTGKELVAEAIHFNSRRKDKPFIKVNCGAISQNLFESEFFGHKKGSFTGASCDKMGKFALADKGTIFLDEIGDLSLDMQVKLLRVLNDGTFTALGDIKEKKVDVRVITATNKDIHKLIQNGDFRDDLYFRIADDVIELPALQERGNDLILIADKLISNLNKKYRKSKYLGKNAIDKLCSYRWNGNIRELKSVLERAYIYAEIKIVENDIKIHGLTTKTESIIIPDSGIDFDSDIIPGYYHAALKKTNGNKKKAAELLNIPEKTFLHRLKSKNVIYKK